MKSLTSVFRIRLTSNDQPNRPVFPLVAKVTGLDAREVRRYFAGLESLAHEARHARDPRVLDLALRVVARQAETIRDLEAAR